MRDRDDDLDEQRLLSILKAEHAEASSYQSSDLAKAQEEALNRYYAKPYGNEAVDRSKVVTHDVEDTINWIMPDLMRTFAQTEELVSVKPLKPEDDQAYEGSKSGRSRVECMASYLNHVFWDDNRGFESLHDFLFDGLLSRIGLFHVGWEDPEAKPAKIIQGLSQEGLQKYLGDQEYEILGYDEEQGPQGPVFMLEVRHTPAMGHPYLEAVPPEEFGLQKQARNIEEAKYHYRKRRKYVAEIARQFPKKKQELLERRPRSDELGPHDDGRIQARHGDDNLMPDPMDEAGRRECTLVEEFIRIDFDNDGIVELRHVKRVDDIILENTAVEASEFVLWTPHRVSHKAIGRSMADILDDIQRIRTEITRSYLDGLQQALTPRVYANRNKLKADTIDALAENEQGAVILTDDDPRNCIMEATSPDISGPALTALDYWDQRSQETSGVTKQSQGMDPQAMNKTATGIDLLQAAAKTRIEMIARWAGFALEEVYQKLLKLVVAHQNGARQVKLFGEWCEIDPRTWSDENAVSVHVGSAGVSRQQRLMNLGMIASKQEQVIATAGPGNPLVTIQHLRNTYAAMVNAMGFRDATEFFGDIGDEELHGMSQPQPDPEMAAIQAKTQLETSKAQHAAQLSEAELMQKQRMAQMDFEAQRELAQQKAANELEIARLRIVAEGQIARERAAAEMELAVWKASQENDLARQRLHLDHKAKINGSGGAGSGGVRFGGDIG